MSVWQETFILVVIGLGPLAAAVLLWTAYARAGAIALAGSMAGAFVFGVYYHYVAVSPDNVEYLPPGVARELFRASAFLVAALQLLGVVTGLWSVPRVRAAS